MGGYDEAERRARLLAERAGIPWDKADVSAWLALADMEREEIKAHEPADWQIVGAVLMAVSGVALGLWSWLGGGA